LKINYFFFVVVDSLKYSISSAVNDPTGKLLDIKNSKYFSPIPTTTFPQFSPAIFNPYLHSLMKPYSQYKRNHFRNLVHFNPFMEDDPEFADSNSLEEDGSVDIIPRTFFSEHFSLQNPDTFQLVYEEESQSAILLQEKLSYYLDLVEMKIVQQVSERSASFFSALSTLEEVHEQVLISCQNIEIVRKKIIETDKLLALKSLEVTLLQQRRAKLIQLYQIIKSISEITQAKSMVRVLLSQYDYGGAIDLSLIAQQLIEGELAGIKCIRHFGTEFTEMVNFSFFFFFPSFLHSFLKIILEI